MIIEDLHGSKNYSKPPEQRPFKVGRCDVIMLIFCDVAFVCAQICDDVIMLTLCDIAFVCAQICDDVIMLTLCDAAFVCAHK